MDYLNPSVAKPNAMDRWNAIAEQYFNKRNGLASDRRVWQQILDEAWEALAANVIEPRQVGEHGEPKYKAVIGWSGPMFNTMDGGDYDWGMDTYYSNDSEDLMNFVVATMIAMKLDGFQAAECEIEGSTIYMKHLIIPWEQNS